MMALRGARVRNASGMRDTERGALDARPPRTRVDLSSLDIRHVRGRDDGGTEDALCISYSSSRESGSEAVSSRSSGSVIHSWYFCGGGYLHVHALREPSHELASTCSSLWAKVSMCGTRRQRGPWLPVRNEHHVGVHDDRLLVQLHRPILSFPVSLSSTGRLQAPPTP